MHIRRYKEFWFVFFADLLPNMLVQSKGSNLLWIWTMTFLFKEPYHFKSHWRLDEKGLLIGIYTTKFQTDQLTWFQTLGDLYQGRFIVYKTRLIADLWCSISLILSYLRLSLSKWILLIEQLLERTILTVHPTKPDYDKNKTLDNMLSTVLWL